MADEKRYFWLRLYDDFFTSKRIKKLRGLAGGDTYTIIYLKMQLKALKAEGYLYFDNVMNDFAEELALDIDENPDDVRVTIQYLLTVGLLECSENGEEYFLTYLPNLIGSETASAQRVRDFRRKKKEQKALHCNTSVTDVKRVGNAEIDIEIEKDKEIEKDNSISSLRSDILSDRTDLEKVVSLWNQLDGLGDIKGIRGIGDSGDRKRLVTARLKEYGIDGFRDAIEKIKTSDFLQGKHNGRAWVITFDWLIRPNNFPKVLEGNYDNKNEGKGEWFK